MVVDACPYSPLVLWLLWCGAETVVVVVAWRGWVGCVCGAVSEVLVWWLGTCGITVCCGVGSSGM